MTAQTDHHNFKYQWQVGNDQIIIMILGQIAFFALIRFW